MDLQRKTEIRAAAGGATPGPWHTGGYFYRDNGRTTQYVWDDPRPGDASGTIIAKDALVADAAFLALAREAVPELLAEVDRLEAELAAARRVAISAVAVLQEVRIALPSGRYSDFAAAHLPALEQATEPWCDDEIETPA